MNLQVATKEAQTFILTLIPLLRLYDVPVAQPNILINYKFLHE